MKHGHSKHVYPADKLIPKEVLKFQNSKQRKVTKHIHIKKSRKYLKNIY